LFGLRAGHTNFQKIDDLGFVAQVWVRFKPTFVASHQGVNKRVDTRRIQFTQEKHVFARAVRKMELLQADDE